MQVIMPSNTVPKKKGTYKVKVSPLIDGERRWFEGDEYIYKGWITMPEYGDIVHCLVQEKEWYSETTEWFSTKEFVPPVVGWYECKLQPLVIHPRPYLFYWDGNSWLCGGWYFGSPNGFNLVMDSTLIKANRHSENVLAFRGVKHEWKNK